MRESLAHAGALFSMLVIAACVVFVAMGDYSQPILQTGAFAIFALVFCSLAIDYREQ